MLQCWVHIYLKLLQPFDDQTPFYHYILTFFISSTVFDFILSVIRIVLLSLLYLHGLFFSSLNVHSLYTVKAKMSLLQVAYR